jgi:Spy/CpxP family protein refolding chaperone
MSLLRSLVLTAMVSVVLGGVGVWVGSQFLGHDRHRNVSPHELIHERLNLTVEQQQRIAQTEAQHAEKRRVLEAEMRSANAELAKALLAHHAYTTEVGAAVEHFHHAMGDLQKETIEHMLAMRAVLTAGQAAEFDQTLVQSLTDSTR